jgi:hypothetical protein
MMDVRKSMAQPESLAQVDPQQPLQIVGFVWNRTCGEDLPYEWRQMRVVVTAKHPD